MTKLIFCLVVFALLYSSNSDTLEDGYEFRGATQRFRDDENFIVNGDFNLPALQWFTIWQYRESIEGWSSADEIERGRGHWYNANWGSITIVDLDGSHNDVLKQRIPLQPGHYILSFRWAGRSDHLWSCGMSIYWNNRKIFEVLQAPDNQIHQQHLPIFVPREKIYVLELRGEGKSDKFGMTVANFSLKKDRSKKYINLIKSPIKDGQIFDRVDEDLQLGQDPAV